MVTIALALPPAKVRPKLEPLLKAEGVPWEGGVAGALDLLESVKST